MLSKCVQPNELGKIYSLLASLEAAGNFVLFPSCLGILLLVFDFNINIITRMTISINREAFKKNPES